MLNYLFPMGEYWSWATFILYVIVAIVVTAACRKGATYNASFLQQPRKNPEMLIKANQQYALAIFVLVLLGSLRSSQVGPDTHVYVERFENAASFKFDWDLFLRFQLQEPGFQLYMLLIRSLTSNYSVLFVVTYTLLSCAYISFIRYFFDEKSDYTVLLLFIYYYVANMSGMRAALGTVFLLYSYIAIDQKRYTKAILLTLLGMMFHYTMLFNLYVIGAVWLLRDSALLGKWRSLREKRWVWVVVVGIVIVCSFGGVELLRTLLAGTKYDYYVPKDLGKLSYLGSMIYVLFGAVALLFIKSFFSKGGKGETVWLISMCFLITYPALFVTGAYRIPNYYILPRLTVWSHCVNAAQLYTLNHPVLRKQKVQSLLKIVLPIVVLMYMLFRFTRSAEDGHFVYMLK